MISGGETILLWLISVVALLLGAASWVAAALVVALVAVAQSLDPQSIIHEFVMNVSHPVTIFTLWTIDVMIAAVFLQDPRVRAGMGRFVGSLTVALVVFSVAGLFLPLVWRDFVASHEGGEAAAVVGSLVAVRFISYVPSEVAHPVSRVSAVQIAAIEAASGATKPETSAVISTEAPVSSNGDVLR